MSLYTHGYERLLKGELRGFAGIQMGSCYAPRDTVGTTMRGLGEILEGVVEFVVGAFLLGTIIVSFFLIYSAVKHWGVGGITLSLVGALFLTSIVWKIECLFGLICLSIIYALLLLCGKIAKSYFEWIKDCITWFYRHLRS